MKFCIVGTGRCGSTLIRNMFDLHPDVFVFNETHWIPKMYQMIGTGTAYPTELARILKNTYHINGEPVTDIGGGQLLELFDDEREVTVSDFCNTVGMFFARNEGKQFWADKTPDYGPWISVIQRLWPNCKIMHLIRNGVDTAVSMSRHPGYQWLNSAGEDSWSAAAFNKYYEAVPLVECSLEEFGTLWYRRLQRIRNEAKLLRANSYREFRLESLVTEPEQTLKSMATFVNLPIQDQWVKLSMKTIDTARICKPPRSNFLGKRELKLLHKLGY